MSSLALWTGIFGSILLALNVGASKYAFIIMLVSSCAWVSSAKRLDDNAIMTMNVFYCAVNVLAIIRWVL